MAEIIKNKTTGGDTMSKIYDYNEYQDQRVKVTYTNKRQYKKEDIVGRYGQVVKTTGDSIAVQIDGMYNAASSNGLYWFSRSELNIIKDESEDNKMTGFEHVAIVNLVKDYSKRTMVLLYIRMNGILL